MFATEILNFLQNSQQLWHGKSTLDNMIVSRFFIAAIILPYGLSFPLENDLSLSQYLEELENRIHNLETPGKVQHNLRLKAERNTFK